MISRLYEWDEEKEGRNRRIHDIPFSAVEGFDWEAAIVAEDMRRDYGERRFIALGRVGRRVHVLVFTPRGERVRIISLRKANAREVRRYEQSQD